MLEMLSVGARAKLAASSGDTLPSISSAPLEKATIPKTSPPSDLTNARNVGLVTPYDSRLRQRSAMTPEQASP